MNKRICSFGILILVLLSGFNANAQQMYIGARVGANLSNWSYDTIPSGGSLSVRTGFLAGAQFDYNFNDMWAVSAQALYDEKGSNENYNQTSTQDGETISTTGTVEFNLNYFEIPILLKANLGTGDIRPYIFAGPSFGFFLSGTENTNTATSSGIVSNSITATQPIADSTVKSPDISAVFGAGVSLKLSSGQLLFIDAAYALGLVNIVNTNLGDNTTVKSRDIRIAAGILFPLD